MSRLQYVVTSQLKSVDSLKSTSSKIPKGIHSRCSRCIRYTYQTKMEAALKDNLFLLGETMSIADIYLYVLCGWCNVFGIDLAGWPALDCHHRAIHARSATQAAWLAEQEMTRLHI
ncbi:glutathione S-transferase C-terminal domain-containing protein [Pantoea rwandensis]